MLRKALLGLAGGVLVLSVAVHVATFFSSVPITMAVAWPLHVATMATFGSVFLFVSLRRKQLAPALGANVDVNKAHREIWRRLPWSWKLVLLGLAAYTAFNFLFTHLVLLEGGGPAGGAGEYHLHDHGKLIRSLTDAEYARASAYEVRGFSGHWIFFSACSTLFFVWSARVLALAEAPRD